MHRASHIDAVEVIDFLMREKINDVRIAGPTIGVHMSVWSQVRSQRGKQGLALQVRYRECDDLSRVSAQHAEYGLLARPMAAFGAFAAYAPRLVASLPADERLIYLDDAAEWADPIAGHERAQMMQHAMHAPPFDTRRLGDSNTRPVPEERSNEFLPFRK